MLQKIHYFNENEVINKTYYAVCEGIIDKNLTINKNIDTLKNEYGYNVQKRVISKNGKKAITYVEPIKVYNNRTLLKIALKHGRTHQIRVHLSSINHPLIGDELYGQKSDDINHTALSCSEMSFIHPITNENINLKVDIPKDIQNLTRDKV